MAGPLLTQVRSPADRELFLLLCVGVCGDRAMGKFFLVIIAISVAVLLAMSAYVISL
jgi:hypothetical protein